MDLQVMAKMREEAIKDSRCMSSPLGCGRPVQQVVISDVYVTATHLNPYSYDIKGGFTNGSLLARYRSNGLCETCQNRYIEGWAEWI